MTSPDESELEMHCACIVVGTIISPMCFCVPGTGFQIPTAAANALSVQPNVVQPGVPAEVVAPPIATQCFMLSNMFDPHK